MATRTVRRNTLVGQTSISFIRPQVISFNVSETKPNTRLYAFFDGVSVDQHILPQPLTTNSDGALAGYFYVPANTFNTGTRLFRVQDSPVFDRDIIAGSTMGSASANFTSTGLRQTFQETVSNTWIAPPPPIILTDPPRQGGGGGGGGRSGDPLAQTFFTYGVKGGCFVTAIDLYFKTRDSLIPVSVEIREVVNGYPGITLVSPFAKSTLTPSSVNLSNNASAVTKFAFSRPIYLEQDRDYCFVILSNSNSYNVWTSKFGDKSIETGKTIFEQPYIGSLFKSENNITWTAEQSEDIKFTLYKAKFDVATTRDVTFRALAPAVLVDGFNASVVSGSATVTVNLPFQHGHQTGDKVVFSGKSGSVFRGIPNSAITSDAAGWSITALDNYAFKFDASAAATSTGTLAASGVLNLVSVVSGGSGYTGVSLTVSGGGATTQATAQAVVDGGVITDVTILTPGVGYTSQPTITITSSSGSGAVLEAFSEAIFVVALNRKFQNATPVVPAFLPQETSLTSTLKTTSSAYITGQALEHPINTPGAAGALDKTAVLVTSAVESVRFGSAPSTQLIVRLGSSNENVSPLLDFNERPRLHAINYLISEKTDPISNSELTPVSGTALARYISKITTLETTSKGAKILVSAACVRQNGFEVFIRTSLSSSTVEHTAGGWSRMTALTDTNLSTDIDEFKDYEFNLDNLQPFNVYDIKIVLYSSAAHLVPSVANYRCTILAT